MSERMIISTECETLEDGERVKLVCPFCGGGSSEEVSLSVVREGTALLYICFRASCGETGAIGGTRGVAPKPTIALPPDRTWRGIAVPLPHNIQGWIYKEWGILRPPSNWRWAPEEERIAMPIVGPTGMQRGWVLRTVHKGVQPKARIHKNVGDTNPTQSWYVTRGDGPTIIVEDIASALRASRYINSVSLLGTHIGADKAAEIRDSASLPIIIALDRDATLTAIRLQEEWGSYFGDSHVLMLEQDIKNMREEELRCLMATI